MSSLTRRSNVSFSKAVSSQKNTAKRSAGGIAANLEATEQNTPSNFLNFQQKKLENNFDDNFLPSSIGDYLKEEYEEYLALLEYDKFIQERMNYLIRVLNIACTPSQDEDIIRHRKRTIRLHIYNTFENQKCKNADLDSFSSNEYIHTGLPKWTLKIHGKVLGEKEYSENFCFTSCFSRIMIITNKETIIWDKRHPEYEDVDGLEVVRLGDVEHPIKILFFVDFRIPIFRLSPELSRLVRISEASLPRITRCIWRYAMDNELQSPHDYSVIKTDALLKNLYGGVEEFRLSDLPSLLKRHLYPPRPITLTHNLKLHGDWIDSESTYDLIIDSTDSGALYTEDNLSSNTLGSSFSSYSNSSLNMLTEDEKMKYEKIQTQINSVDKQISIVLNKIKLKVSNRSFFMSFAHSPIHFIQTLLTSKHLQPQKLLVDESYMYEYEIADCQSSYYRQPWVNRAVKKYLQSSHESYDDQICQVLMSMQIPDPRKRFKDEVENMSLLGVRGTGCTSATSRRSRISADTPYRNKSHVKPKRKIQKEAEK